MKWQKCFKYKFYIFIPIKASRHIQSHGWHDGKHCMWLLKYLGLFHWLFEWLLKREDKSTANHVKLSGWGLCGWGMAVWAGQTLSIHLHFTQCEGLWPSRNDHINPAALHAMTIEKLGLPSRDMQHSTPETRTKHVQYDVSTNTMMALNVLKAPLTAGCCFLHFQGSPQF